MLEQFKELGYPELDPVPAGAHRPLWSVMIPTYNCAGLLRETLNTVLVQDAGPDKMHIEVIDDASTKDDPEGVVRELGQGRVAFHRHKMNVGATANFNCCLARSRGHLVHILHGDDTVLPGFYTRMEQLFDLYPMAGSAFCRFAYTDAAGVWTDLSELNQRSAGIYPDALSTIATRNWAQFAAVVLRRSLVEDVGGFHPSLIHAADWDLWKRAALVRAVAYDPAVLACYRIFDGNDSSRLVKTGANTADIRRSIELSAQYLPRPASIAWINEARRGFARSARNLASRMLAKGEHEAFRNQLRESLLLEPASWWSIKRLGICYWYLKQQLKAQLRKLQSAGAGNGWPRQSANPASATS
jgi:glycosyltransferase involved in cell wall biosynthesis